MHLFRVTFAAVDSHIFPFVEKGDFMLIKNDKHLYDSLTLSELLLALNLRRIIYVSFAYLIFIVLSFIADLTTVIGITQLSYILISCVAVVFILISSIFYKYLLYKPFLGKLTYRIFWLLLGLAMIPFFINDAKMLATNPSYIPLTATLFCFIMVVIPVFTRPELFISFSIFFVCNLAIALGYKASSSYILYIIGLSAAGLIFAYLTQYQNTMTIWNLKSETQLDSLTCLLNRKTGLQRMKFTIDLSRRYNKKVGIFMVDIDFFKAYNDHYGHVKGDVALKLVSDALCRIFARSSDVVFRYGGEEFVICAIVENDADAMNMANRLLKEVSDMNIEVPENPVADHLTISIGYTIYDGDNARVPSELELIDWADSAMYAAKAEGRNRARSHTQTEVE